MATKLSGSGTTGLANAKGFRTRDSDGFVWSTAGTPAFEAYNAANIANYGIAAAETGSTGIYSFTDPAETTPGRFRLIAAAGASLTVADVANNTFWEEGAGVDLNRLADVVLRRNADLIEDSAYGDALSEHSLYGLLQQAQNSNTTDNPGFITIYRTDDVELGQIPITSGSANPITGVG